MKSAMDKTARNRTGHRNERTRRRFIVRNCIMWLSRLVSPKFPFSMEKSPSSTSPHCPHWAVCRKAPGGSAKEMLLKLGSMEPFLWEAVRRPPGLPGPRERLLLRLGPHEPSSGVCVPIAAPRAHQGVWFLPHTHEWPSPFSPQLIPNQVTGRQGYLWHMDFEQIPRAEEKILPWDPSDIAQ